METIRLTVDRESEDIVAYLADALPTLPLGAIRRLVARGKAEVDGKRVPHSYAPQIGQAVTLTLPDEPMVRYEPRKLDLEVLYEDAEVLAINKPVGLPVVPDPTSIEATLINGLLHYVGNESPQPCRRVYIVHRLDKETSGVLLVAKTSGAGRRLSMAFAERAVHKEYLAVVRGEVAAAEGEIDEPIAQHTRGRMRLRRRRGRPALSRYRVAERFRDFTLLEVRPVTGRQHQVRLHCSGLGHPLAVDRLYGGREAVYLSEIKTNYRAKAGRPEAPLITRLTLHARRIDVPAPEGGRCVVEAPLPADFARLLRMLRKYAARP